MEGWRSREEGMVWGEESVELDPVVALEAEERGNRFWSSKGEIVEEGIRRGKLEVGRRRGKFGSLRFGGEAGKRLG